jgi:hypothetical protein
MFAFLAVASQPPGTFKMKRARWIPRSARRVFLRATVLLTRGVAMRALGLLGLARLLGHNLQAQTILGSNGGDAVMAGGTVTINGATSTTITGNLGAIGSIAGPGSNYTITDGTQLATLVQNQADFTRAFDGLAAMTATVDLTGMILGTTAGANILTPGVYHFDSTAQLTGALVLDAQNQSNAVWVFQIGSTLTTAAASSVTFVNLAANSAANDGVFWQVGSTTVLGANTAFEGNILSGTTLNLGTSVTINQGRALTGSNTITLDSDTINFVAANSGYSGGLAFSGSGNTISAIPEPATSALIAAAGALGLVVWRRRRAAN